MPDNPAKIDWKKRLEAMKHRPSNEPTQSVVTPIEPPLQELWPIEAVPPKLPEPEPDAIQEVTPDVQEVKPIEACQQSPVSSPDSQVGRVDKLERQLRSLKVIGMLTALLAVIAVLGLAFMIKKGTGRVAMMSAETLTIKDSKGLSRAWIGERDGQVQVELRDQAGRRRLSLGLGAAGEPRLTFYNKEQKILSAIVPLPDGQPGIKLLNQAGESVATIPAPSPPAPVVPEPQALVPLPTPSPQPEKVPPEASRTEQKSATKPDGANAAESAIIVANPGGKAYHLPGCPWVKNIPLSQLLKFPSAAEAAKAGYHPCRHCSPNHRN